MALTATGIGSGLDVEGLVTRLMEAERLPLEQRLIRRETTITQDISALGSLKGALSSLQTGIVSANSPGTYSRKIASSSDSDSLTATASAQAALGSYSVTVSNLASAVSLAVRSDFSSLSDTVGSGTLTFTLGATKYTQDNGDPPNTANDTYDSFVAKAGASSHTVTIDSSNNTLSGVRDAINAANIDVTASIVKEGSAYRLLFSGRQTGAENGIQVAVVDTGDSNNADGNGLSRLAFNSAVGTANVYQTAAATDASFSINGLALTNASNAITDAVTGLSLSLRKVTSSPATISINDNKSGIKAAINAFVSSYNQFGNTYQSLTGYDSNTGIGGQLQGDFTARSIGNQLRVVLGSKADDYDGPFSRMAEIGVSLSAAGQLVVDDTKLEAAFSKDFDSVAGVLTRHAASSNSGALRMSSLTDSVPKGTYAVEITSMATSGALTATVPSAGFPVAIDGSSDEFVLSVDGVKSGVIALTQTSYTSLSQIASELQTKINADSQLRGVSKAVTVTVSGDDIEVRSNSLGSSSSVSISNSGSDSTIAALGLSLATASVGTDLVGKINGAAGVAAGNLLSGAEGSLAAGLSLEVVSTTGGQITVSDGVLEKIDNLLSALLGADNSMDSRMGSLKLQADSLKSEREVMERRLEGVEARYRRQFNALDMLLSQLNGTGSFVTDQLANIPIPRKSTK